MLIFSDIVKGMKIDRETKAPEQASRAEQVRHLLDMVKGKQEKASKPRSTERVQRRTAQPRQRETL